MNDSVRLDLRSRGKEFGDCEVTSQQKIFTHTMNVIECSQPFILHPLDIDIAGKICQ